MALPACCNGGCRGHPPVGILLLHLDIWQLPQQRVETMDIRYGKHMPVPVLYAKAQQCSASCNTAALAAQMQQLVQNSVVKEVHFSCLLTNCTTLVPMAVNMLAAAVYLLSGFGGVLVSANASKDFVTAGASGPAFGLIGGCCHHRHCPTRL
jgi:hypothetical protein